MFRTVPCLGFGGVVLVATAAMIMSATNFDPAFVAGALVAYLGGATIIAYQHPMRHLKSLGLANTVTLARLLIACLFAGYAAVLVAGATPSAQIASAAAVMGALALAMDGLDGWIARRSGTASAFGARFDMEVDAFFILVLAIVAWASEKAGAWVLMSGAARYLYVMASVWFAPLTRPVFPSRRRKIVCVIQAAVLVAVLLPDVTSPLSDTLCAIGLLFLLYSFAADIRWQIGAPIGAGLGAASE